MNTSKEARLVQKQYKELTATNLKLNKKQKETQRQSDSVLKNLTSAKDEFESKRGPFKEKLRSVLEGLHLERQAYHSRALVGNDVHKLTKTDTINKIAKVLKPFQVKLPDGNQEKFSSVEKMNKIHTLLTKFGLCFELYTKNRPLCRHEMALLSVRCASSGCWMPVNYPEVVMIRKFHVIKQTIPYST